MALHTAPCAASLPQPKLLTRQLSAYRTRSVAAAYAWPVAAAAGGPSTAGSGDVPQRCPMLRTPGYVRRGLLRELHFMEDPAIVQDEILGGEGAAEGNWMTMRALFVGDAQLAKQVLATQVRAEVPCRAAG